MSTIATYMKTGSNGMVVNRAARMEQFVADFSVTNVTATDIIKVWQAPEDCVVLAAGYEIITAGTASGTLDFGLAGGTEFLSAIALDAAALTKAMGAFAAPVFVKDSDTLDFQINTSTMVLGKIRLWWVVCDVSELGTDNDLVA